MQFKKFKNKKSGFTIIETMIAVSLFLVVVTIGMGALLNANLLHQKSQDMRSIIDNLNFIMEDMSKNIRTGYNYRCYDASDLVWDQSKAQTSGLSNPKSCALGGVLVFELSDGDSLVTTDQWVYKIESSGIGQPFNMFKSVDGGANWTQLNPSEVHLDSFSGFSVLGAEPPAGDKQQPFVTIRLSGTITYKGVESPFSLQTSVSQRLVDLAN